MKDTLRTYESIFGLLPDVDNPTPLVRLNHVPGFDHTEVFAKLEWYNPFGSVKDRIASRMLSEAEADETIQPGQQLVEPTSGNTGLGLAMIANASQYSLTTPLSSAIPVEKKTMLRLFGAKVEELEDDLCPAPGAPEGAIARAMEIMEQPDFVMLNQYGNRANPEAHYRTTGPEVWRQTSGMVTHFVAALGTCGTISGVGRFLKENNANVKVIGVYPTEGHDIPGVRSIPQLKQTEFFEPEEYNKLVEVKNRQAYEMCLRLNREESIPAGPSSGLALAGALEVIPDEPGNRVVVIFADSVFKYGSSVVKNLDGLGAPPARSKSRREELLDAMIENARHNPKLTIDVDSAHELWERERPLVVDVRDPDTYGRSHIADAINIPLLDLPDHLGELPDDRTAPVLSVCQVGNTSLSGVLYLNSLGFSNARSIEGGTTAWQERGFATVSG